MNNYKKIINCIKFVILLVTIICYNVCFSQFEDIPFDDIIPPSPEASSLGKYGEFPVSHSTGTPNINIPLGEISGNILKVPISLSYHSSGNKVEDIPGWVGLGWSLNAGGAITRSVRGIEDENANGFINICKYLPEYGYENNEHFNLFNSLAEGYKDGEPDIFCFNFLNYSGQFVIGNDTNIYIIPYKNIKIQKFINGNDLYKFVIITEDGTKCIFGTSLNNDTAIEETKTHYHEPTTTYKTSWYLTEIISANSSDTIYLNYVDNDYNYYLTASERKRCLLSKYNGCGTVVGCGDPIYNKSTIFIYSKRLSEIISKKGKLIFSNSGRGDILGARKLDSISLYSRIGSGDEFAFEKKYSFNYSYMNPNGEPVEKRLMLDSIVEFGKNTINNPPYRFTYNQTPLPERDSKAQDHWGFYNGENDNISLIPPLEYGTYNWGGGTRDPDSDNMKAGIIEAIYYPTGGYTKFEFEPHYYSTYIHQNDATVTHVAVAHGTEGTPLLEDPADINRDTVTFTYPANEIRVTAKVEISLSGKKLIEDLQGTHHCYTMVYIKNKNTQDEILINAPEHNYNSIRIFDLIPGHEYELYAQAYWTENAKAYIRITYEALDRSSIPSKTIAGGLRIKRIRTFDGMNEQIKTYSYVKGNDPDISSGKLMSRPNYYYRMGTVSNGAYALTNIYCDYIIRQSSSVAPLGTSGGSSVFYPEITEYIGENGENGKIYYKYYYTQDIGNINYPFPPRFSMNWARGKLLNQKIYRYDKTSKSYIIQKEIINEYSNFMGNNENSADIYGIKVGFAASGINYLSINSNDESAYEKYFKWEYFPMYSRWVFQTKQTNKTFDLNNPDSYSTAITEYIYDNPEHAQLTKTVITQSDGSKIINENRYLEDIIDICDCEKKFADCQLNNFHFSKQCRNGAYIRSSNSGLNSCNDDFSACFSPCWSNFWNCEQEHPEFLGTYYTATAPNCYDLLAPCQYCYDNYDNCKNTAISNYITQCENDSISGYNDCVTEKNECYQYQPIQTNISTPYILLFNRHAINTPVEQLVWKIPPSSNDTLLISGKIIQYDTFNNQQVLPYKIHNLEISSPISKNNFTYFKINQDGTMSIDSHYNLIATIDNYDNYDNIISYHKKEDLSHALIWGYNNTLPVAEAINASPNETFYTSFEPGKQNSNTYQPSNPIKNKDLSITGDYYYNTWSDVFRVENIEPGEYLFSFWSDNSGNINTGTNISILDQDVSEPDQNGFRLYTYKINSSGESGNYVEITSWQKIDEVRIFPVDAQMITYSYDQLIGRNSVSDLNNITGYFEYDNMNRLTTISDQNRDIKNVYQYNFCNGPLASIDHNPAIPEVNRDTYFNVLNVFNLNDIQSYYWEFGDGSTSSDSSPSHKYMEEGNYLATLTITDISDITVKVTKYIKVQPYKLKGTINFSPDDPIASKDELSFTANVELFNPDTNIENYNWNFGDNTTSTLANPIHLYSIPGTYKIILNVEDIAGNTGQLTKYIYISPFNIYFNISQDPSNPVNNEAVTFTAININCPTEIQYYIWEYNDGSDPDTTFNNSTTHIYNKPNWGYDLVVTIVEEYGFSRTKMKTVGIDADPITSINYEISGSTNYHTGVFNPTDTVIGEVTNINGGYKPYRVDWEVLLEDTYGTDTITIYHTYEDTPFLVFDLGNAGDTLEGAIMTISVKVSDNFSNEITEQELYMIAVH